MNAAVAIRMADIAMDLTTMAMIDLHGYTVAQPCFWNFKNINV